MVLSKPLISALGAYYGQLYEHPLRTKAITCCVIATLGNFTSQKLGGAKVINVQNLVAYGAFGLLFGGTVPHYFYSFLESFVPEEASFAIAKRVLIERLIFSPLYQAFTLYTLARLEGKSHEAALKQLQSLYWTVLTSSWKYLTLLYILNMSVVPPVLRVLVMNLIGFFWTIYIANRRKQAEFKKTD